MSIVADPMDTVEFRADHAIRNLCLAVSEIDDLRRSNEARGSLMHDMSRNDIELSRDRLSRILDDLGGE